MEENELVPAPNNSLSRVINILKLTQKILQESSLNIEEKWNWWNNLSNEWKLVLCRSADLYNKLYKKEIINGQFNQKINADELNVILQLERIVFYEAFFHDFIDDEKLNWSIDDLTPLSTLVNLKILEFEDTQIKDISPLFNLLKLETLSLSRNENIDDNTLKELREHLPECSVRFY